MKSFKSFHLGFFISEFIKDFRLAGTGVIVIPCAVWAVAVPSIKFVSVPPPKPYMDFHLIFRICLSKEDLQLIGD